MDPSLPSLPPSSHDSWYSRWHQHPKHRLIHWLVLLIIAAIVLIGLTWLLNYSPLLVSSLNTHAAVTLPAQEAANVSDLRQQIIASTNKLHEALRAFKELPEAAQADALANLRDVALQRQQLLITGLAQDPDAVLEHFLPRDAKTNFPTEIQSLLEDEVVLEGEYNVAIVDNFEEEQAILIHELHRPKEKPLRLHLGKKLPSVEAGSDVRLHGIKLGEDVAVLDMTPSGTEVPAASSQVEGISDLVTSEASAQTVPPVPAFSSLPGAAQTLYLDFNGHFEPQWGGWTNVTTPAFNSEGDTSTFSANELAAIEQIWKQVAEDYAPFKINVTTVEPNQFGNGSALRVAIGGSSYDWYGNGAGGVCYVNSFTSSVANVCYVFPSNLANGQRYIGEASSHESGHGFGLYHQSSYDGNGSRVATYYGGPGDGTAPIMGLSYYATRGLWWYGTASCATCYQDDLAILSRSQNLFLFRPDDHSNSTGGATPLAISGNQVTGSGLISPTLDSDYFITLIEAGLATFTVHVPPTINNLDAKVELRDSQGSVLASSDPTDNFSATVSATLPQTDNYYLHVTSHGKYGDLGQYSITRDAGIVSSPSPTPLPPDNTPPQVSITNPANSTLISRNINFTSSATDSSGIKTLTLSVDGKVKKTCKSGSCTYSLKASDLTAGSHTLTATAIDKSPAANSNTATVQVTK